MFLVNSQVPLVTEICFYNTSYKNRHPLYQRYGTILPNSLAHNNPIRLKLLTQSICVDSWYEHMQIYIIFLFSLTLRII